MDRRADRELEFRESVYWRRLLLAPDGKRLVVLPITVTAGEPKGNLHVMMLVNWFEELHRRMPPGKT